MKRLEEVQAALKFIKQVFAPLQAPIQPNSLSFNFI